jgi:apolipoprotein N-acyltransferase
VILVISAQYALFLPFVGQMIRRLPRWGSLAAAVAWTGFEYLRTRGFLGFPFGLLGLSQFEVGALVRLGSITGIWGVSFLLAFSNAILARLLSLRIGGRRQEGREANGSTGRLRPLIPAIAIFSLCLACGLGFGLAAAGTKPDSSGSTGLRVALVQSGAPGAQRTPDDYRRALLRLEELTRAALGADPDLIVWPESAIVPSINWHLRVRDDPEVWPVVKEALDFMGSLAPPLLLGNALAEIAPSGPSRSPREDKNAALLTSRGETIGSYGKTRLVPFAEHFPFGERVPALRDSIARAFGSRWAAGSGPSLLRLPSGVAIGTPICFEDGFGDYCAGFAREGARLLAVLTSDAWAMSASCQVQHLAQSVFRAAETGLPIVRAASSGQTAYIDGRGRIVSELEAFSPNVLVVDLSLRDPSPTPYARAPDAFGIACLAAALLAMASAIHGAWNTKGPRIDKAGGLCKDESVPSGRARRRE